MKNIAVNQITQATKDKWLPVAKSCQYATYFHTPYWYDNIAPKQKHVTLDVSFSDGASAVIPMAKIKRMGGLLTDSFSSPYGTYGGWISASDLSEEHIKLLAGVITSEKNLIFRVNPFDNLSSALIPALISGPNLSHIQFKEDFTYTLDLTRDVRKIFSGLTRGHRNAINHAAHNGVTVKAADSIDEWEQYYGLYRNTVERWRAGGPSLKPRTVYPLSLFRRIYENRAGNEILWLAVKDGEPVAGVLVFYWNRHVVAWHAAASAAHFDLRPNNLLLWEVMLDAARRGYGVFDFNPSGGYGGVESYKKHFGAERVPSPVISTKTPLRRIITMMKKVRRGELCSPATPQLP